MEWLKWIEFIRRILLRGWNLFEEMCLMDGMDELCGMNGIDWICGMGGRDVIDEMCVMD